MRKLAILFLFLSVILFSCSSEEPSYKYQKEETKLSKKEQIEKEINSIIQNDKTLQVKKQVLTYKGVEYNVKQIREITSEGLKTTYKVSENHNTVFLILMGFLLMACLSRFFG